MFDIGFLEILVILIIALLVIGPERMPELARKIGRFSGKIKRFVNSVKEDSQMQETIKDFKDSVNFEEQKQQINTINQELQSGLDFDKNLKTEDFQRPTFGGAENNDSPISSSQFNKAPSQPNIEKPVTEKAENENKEPKTVSVAPAEKETPVNVNPTIPDSEQTVMPVTEPDKVK